MKDDTPLEGKLATGLFVALLNTWTVQQLPELLQLFARYMSRFAGS
jgi:hypothetical protein